MYAMSRATWEACRVTNATKLRAMLEKEPDIMCVAMAKNGRNAIWRARGGMDGC